VLRNKDSASFKSTEIRKLTKSPNQETLRGREDGADSNEGS